jgi:hypothetical protein
MVMPRATLVRFVIGAALAVGVSQGVMSAAQAAVTNVPDHTASFNGIVRTVVYHNGVVYVGGAFTAAIQNGQSIPRNHVAAIDEATGTVLPWNPNTSGVVWALAVTDTTAYIGGGFSRVGGQVHTNVASVSSTGSGAVNAAFTARTSGTVQALTLSGSSLYVGGSFTSLDGQSKPDLGAVDSTTGALVSSFNAVANGAVRALQAANGTIYVGGEFTSMNALSRGRYFASVNPTTGTLAASWNSPVGYRILNFATTATHIYAAGDGAGGHLVAANLNGSAQWIVTSDGGYQSVAVLGGTVYAGGHFDNVCSSSRTGAHGACLDGQVTRHKMAAFDLNGTLQSWAPQADSALGAHSMDADPATGRLAVGGEFKHFGNGSISQPYFAQFS